MSTVELNTENLNNISNSKLELTSKDSRDNVIPYVPADHRPPELNISSCGALANFLKASLCSGILAMPLAFKNAGLLVGVMGTIIIGLICIHCIHIFVKTSQELCVFIKRPSLDYANTCYIVFKNGPKSVHKFASLVRFLADWALGMAHLGSCCGYVVLVAESFKQVSDIYGGPQWSVTIFCALTLVILVPLTQITKLKYLVPFSALANIALLSSIVISIYYCMQNAHSLSDRNLYNPIPGVVNFISTSLFAMEGMGVVMPIENEMKKPQQFLGCPGVLTIAMSTVVALFTFIGFTGYMGFGEDVRGSITLNLPQDEILAQVAKILVACTMILSYALMFFVPLDIFWKRIKHKVPENHHRICIASTKLVTTLLIVGLACAVPKLELFMQLAGAVCLSILGITLPIIIETVFRWDKDMGKWRWVLWKNLLILFFSILALVSGVTCSINTMLEEL